MPSKKTKEITREEVEEKLQKFLEKTLPFALEEFEIIVRPATSTDVNSANVQNLVNAIYYVYLQSPPDACSKLHILVRQFAKAFNDEESVKRLENLWKGSGENLLIIPTIETIVIRDMSNPYFIIGKRYNLGYGDTYTLGELNLRLQFVKRAFMDVFCEIYLRHDLKEQFIMPALQAAGTSEVMPSL